MERAERMRRWERAVRIMAAREYRAQRAAPNAHRGWRYGMALARARVAPK